MKLNEISVAFVCCNIVCSCSTAQNSAAVFTVQVGTSPRKNCLGFQDHEVKG